MDEKPDIYLYMHVLECDTETVGFEKTNLNRMESDREQSKLAGMTDEEPKL